MLKPQQMYLVIQNFCIIKHKIVQRRYIIISSLNTLACKGSNEVFKKILLVSLMAVWVLSGPLMGNALADDVKTPAKYDRDFEYPGR